MQEVKTVTFKIDMEFVCNLARNLYWKDKKPLEKSLELLYSIMMGPEMTDKERYEIACLILEGKKVIKGINSGQLYDDDKNFGKIETKIIKHIEIVFKATGAVVEKIDVTGRTRKSIEKIEAGLNINMNHEEYFTRIVTEGGL